MNEKSAAKKKLLLFRHLNDAAEVYKIFCTFHKLIRQHKGAVIGTADEGPQNV